MALFKCQQQVLKQLRSSKRLGKLQKDAGGDDDEFDQVADDVVSALSLDELQRLKKSQQSLEDVLRDSGEGELARLEVPTAQSWFDRVNDRAVDYADQRAAELVTDIDEVTRDQLRTTIADGLRDGDSRDDIIAAIEDMGTFDDDRARRIADHEIRTANGQGRLAAYKAAQDNGIRLKKLWVLGANSCEECIENADAGPIDLDEDFPGTETDMDPGHVNCLLGHTLITAEGVTGYFKRWFEGKICMISIAGDEDISITPNHPILTNRGWVKAGSLQVGDKLVKYVDPSVTTRSVHPQHDHVQTRFEEIFSSLVMTPSMLSTTEPTTAESFHGDGVVNGEVDVILTEGFLKDGVKSSESVKDHNFSLAHSGRRSFDADGMQDLSVQGALSSPLGDVGRHRSGLTLLRGGLSELDQASLWDGTKLETLFMEGSFDGATSKAGKDLEIVDGLPFKIEFVEVLNVRYGNFSGHVYNLSTEHHYYTASNVIVHNCDCATTTVMETSEEEESDEEES